MSSPYIDKEKYVKAIIKKVKCSTAKKKELERQLLLDISTAMEAGESLEDIGSVEEMAEEFNSNLSEEEAIKYKKQRRIKITAIASAVAIVVISAIAYIAWSIPLTLEFGTSGVFEEEVVKNQIEKMILLINDDDYDALSDMSIKEMETFFDENNMDEMKNMIHDNWGEFKGFEKTYLLEGRIKGNKYVIGETTVIYENVTITYLITLDEELKLSGLYIR